MKFYNISHSRKQNKHLKCNFYVYFKWLLQKTAHRDRVSFKIYRDAQTNYVFRIFLSYYYKTLSDPTTFVLKTF